MMAEYGVVEKNIDKVKQWLSEGLSSKKIASLLGCKSSSVLKKIKEHNLINKNKAKRDDNNLLKDKLDIVIELFKTKSMTEIGKTLGHSETSIYNLLKKHGYDTSKYKCKYTVNESYFEKIDTHNKAYFLGWIYSDGNIMPKGKLRIQIQEEDLHILESLKKDIEYTGEIYNLKAVNERCKPQVLLNIDRMKIINDLGLLGLSPNKSLTLTFPSFEQVSKEFFKSFILGFFDGDGSISVRPNGTTIGCGITSTDSFCKSLSDYMKTFDINFGNFYYRRPGKPTGTMFLNTSESKKFLNYLYKDAELKLTRKYLKALPFLLP